MPDRLTDDDRRQRGQPSICLCVDDFGLHAGVNEGALRLATTGRVHAIACLVGGAGWSHRWHALLRSLAANGIDIGLHLDFTESPLLARSRRRLPALIIDSVLRRLDAAEIRAEVRAQLDSFEQALGHGPAFVDGHQHVHQLPIVRHELLDELASRYPDKPPWLRSTHAGGVSWPCAMKARGIQLLGSKPFNSAARQSGFALNRRLLGVYDFSGGPERYRRLLAAWLRSAQNADLLMCHAGLRHAGDALGAARQAEYDVLAAASLDTVLRDAGVRLQPMSRILARQVQPA